MAVLFILILSLYCLLLLVFLFGWIMIRRQSMPVKGTSTPRISVVVAVRNEEENIQTLLHNLSAIIYPVGKLEVIIVNDHSTDATMEKAKSLIGHLSTARLLDLPEGREGKKEALSFGIEAAQFEIIATTDADCQFSKNWLTCLSLYFEQDETKMLVGAVKLIAAPSFLSRLQLTEFASLVGSTAAAIGLRHPIMCSGANLAFQKSAFNEVQGYSGNFQIASGDDEFLMRKINRRYPGGIKFLNYYEAVVSSHAQKSIQDFIHQRLRWAGKWKHNTDSMTQLLAVFIFVSHLAFAGLVIKNFFGPDATLGLVIAKFFLEGVFIFWVGRFLDRRFDILAFLILQIIYPVYVITIGVFSLFSPYRWKNRNYK